MKYVLGSAIGHITQEFVDSFALLPADPYLSEGHAFRFRALGKALVKGGSFQWDDDTYFFQSSGINEYAGGVDRRFAELDLPARDFAESLVNSRAVRELVAEEEFRIGCHQIRITADGERLGLPAPEGFHQDGYDLIAITCVAAENVSGGISLVRERDPDGDVILERTMAPGEVLLLRDREALHYVSPITPKFPDRPAHRDVAVITFAFGGEA